MTIQERSAIKPGAVLPQKLQVGVDAVDVGAPFMQTPRKLPARLEESVLFAQTPPPPSYPDVIATIAETGDY